MKQLSSHMQNLPFFELTVERKSENYYKGEITLHFFNEPLIIHFKGRSLDASISSGFRKILQELKKRTRPLTKSNFLQNEKYS